MDSDPRVGMVVGTYVAPLPGGREIRIGPDAGGLRGDFEYDLLSGFRFITPTWLLRRECLNDAGAFDEQLPNREDWELVFHVLPRWEIRAVREPVLVKHSTPGSVDGNPRNRVQSYQAILKRHAGRWSRYPSTRGIHYYELARAHLQLREIEPAKKALVESIRLRWWWWKPVVAYLALLPGLAFYERMVRGRAALVSKMTSGPKSK
jgi:hypothetical protein